MLISPRTAMVRNLLVSGTNGATPFRWRCYRIQTTFSDDRSHNDRAQIAYSESFSPQKSSLNAD